MKEQSVKQIDLRPYAITQADLAIAEEFWLGDSSENMASRKAGVARHLVSVRLEVMRARRMLFQEPELLPGTRVAIHALGGIRFGTVVGRTRIDTFLGEVSPEQQKHDWYTVKLINGSTGPYLRESLQVLV